MQWFTLEGTVDAPMLFFTVPATEVVVIACKRPYFNFGKDPYTYKGKYWPKLVYRAFYC